MSDRHACVLCGGYWQIPHVYGGRWICDDCARQLVKALESLLGAKCTWGHEGATLDFPTITRLLRDCQRDDNVRAHYLPDRKLIDLPIIQRVLHEAH